MPDLDDITLNPEEIMEDQMDWREGTWTMTEGQKFRWGFDADEIVITLDETNLDGLPAETEVYYLSERQVENMITGLAFQLNKMREERNRGKA